MRPPVGSCTPLRLKGGGFLEIRKLERHLISLLVRFFLAHFTPESLITVLLGGIAAVSLLLLGHTRSGRISCSVFLLMAVAGRLRISQLDQPFEMKQYGSASVEDPPKTIPAPMKGELRSGRGRYFLDQEGRRVLLRGVNLAGTSKYPIGKGTSVRKGFFDFDNVSFVGRPFSLTDSSEHFARLRALGFTFVRLLVTWEAIEHKGPGQYDREYLNYIQQIVRSAARNGISVFIDPHQDVWSRWTGGDGAPWWTLDAVGFNITSLFESGATINQQEYGDPYPQMIWPTDHYRLATGTMNTLFFGGRTFAPEIQIEGQNVQDYLQGHYIASMKEVATVLAGEPNVLGYDTLNEPHTGMLGWQDLRIGGFIRHGWYQTWFQSMQLGEGFPQTVDVYDPPMLYNHTETLNKHAVRAWKDGEKCVWRRAGVWGIEVTGSPKINLPHHFSTVATADVNVVRDHMVPFYKKYANEIRSCDEQSFIFLDRNTDFEDPEETKCPGQYLPEDDFYVWAPHWYDFVPLIFKVCRAPGTLFVHGTELKLLTPSPFSVLQVMAGH